MTKEEVIERFCNLQKEVSDVIGWQHAADCFCHLSLSGSYQNEGKALEFIEKVVRKELVLHKMQTKPTIRQDIFDDLT